MRRLRRVPAPTWNTLGHVALTLGSRGPPSPARIVIPSVWTPVAELPTVDVVLGPYRARIHEHDVVVALNDRADTEAARVLVGSGMTLGIGRAHV